VRQALAAVAEWVATADPVLAAEEDVSQAGVAIHVLLVVAQMPPAAVPTHAVMWQLADALTMPPVAAPTRAATTPVATPQAVVSPPIAEQSWVAEVLS